MIFSIFIKLAHWLPMLVIREQQSALQYTAVSLKEFSAYRANTKKNKCNKLNRGKNRKNIIFCIKI
jgi:hypothetical protein